MSDSKKKDKQAKGATPSRESNESTRNSHVAEGSRRDSGSLPHRKSARKAVESRRRKSPPVTAADFVIACRRPPGLDDDPTIVDSTDIIRAHRDGIAYK